jgi:hypothetical protein
MELALKDCAAPIKGPTTMKRLLALVLTSLVMTSGAAVAKDKTWPLLPKGTRIGVVNILDPEIMHYHAARQTINSYVKIQPVKWNVDEMLLAALQAQPAAANLSLTPVAPTDSLLRARESCFVNAALAKGLAKTCSAALVELASSAEVSYLVVMAPGLNNTDHSDGGPRLEISSTLRGWGFVTHEFAGSKDKPNLPFHPTPRCSRLNRSSSCSRCSRPSWNARHKTSWSRCTSSSSRDAGHTFARRRLPDGADETQI